LGSKFDNTEPRALTEKLKNDQSVDSAVCVPLFSDDSTNTTQTKGQLLRLHAASANGLENIGLFAAAVVAANVAGLSHETLNRLSLTYVGVRALYNVVYYGNTTQARAAARSGLFWSGQIIIVSLFIRAGQALNVLSVGNIIDRTNRKF